MDLGQTHEGTGASVTGDTASGQHRNENNEVHDVRQGLKASISVGNDKGRGVRAASTKQILVIRADGDGDHKGADKVEKRQPDPDGVDGIWNRLLGVLSLSSYQTAGLGTRHSEDTGGHNVEETLEAIGEPSCLVPVAETDGTALGRTAGRDDDHADNDHKDPAKLDSRKDDLTLGKVVDGADVDEHDDDQEDGNPASGRNLLAAIPEAQYCHETGKLVGDGDPPLEPVAPTERETSSRVDEFVGPLHEGRRERVHDGHLSDRLRDGPNHRSREQVYCFTPCQFSISLRHPFGKWQTKLTTDEESGWATVGQTGATSKPQTHTDRRAQGNHSNVPAAQLPLQLTVRAMVNNNAMLDVVMPIM